MGRKFNTAILLIILLLILSGGVAVWELYKLQQIAAEELLPQIHRSVSTIVIGIGVAVVMLIMFMSFFYIYYMRPVKHINRSLQNYLTTRAPFNSTFNCSGEISEMHDMIERLIEQNKRSIRD